MTTLTIDGAPVAVVPVEPTTAMIEAGRAPRGLTMDGYAVDHNIITDKYAAMLATSDSALTAAVVELREALAANRAVLEWMAVNGAKVGPMYSQAVSCLHRSRAALSRVEVSR